MKRRKGPLPNGHTSSTPESMKRANALHGAFTPPKLPASARHRLGSISLCGGAISNCAYPQSVSDGKNIRSAAFGCWACDPAASPRITKTREILFITPPRAKASRTGLGDSSYQRAVNSESELYPRPLEYEFSTENHN